MKADSPQQASPIDYEGAVERLNWRPLNGDLLDFKVIFRSLARELHAQMEVQEEGEYVPNESAPRKRGRPASFDDLVKQREMWGKFEE